MSLRRWVATQAFLCLGFGRGDILGWEVKIKAGLYELRGINMQELANKLIAQARGLQVAAEGDNNETGATGASGRVRYGLWPVINPETPEAAMGIMAALAGLLEQWPDVLVYRLFVRAEGDPAELTNSIENSQFSVDDWQLDYLDENVAIWGTLARAGAEWQLELSLENDLAEDEEVVTITIAGSTLGELVDQLPGVAVEIAKLVGAGYPYLLSAPYDDLVESSDEAMSLVLAAAFRWERDLFLTLWREDSDSIDWAAHLEAFAEAARRVDAGFGGWLAAGAVNRALRPATADLVEDALGDPWQTLLERLPDSPGVYIGAARALQRADEANEAAQLLVEAIERFGDNASVRLALADAYRVNNRLQDMADTLQAGFEADDVDSRLYFYYASLLVAIHRNNIVINRFAFIDAKDRQLVRMLEEASAAYAAGLALDPERIDMLQRRVLLLVELNDDVLWDEFALLAEQDASGELVRSVVDAFIMLEDVSPGLDVLADVIEANPDRVDLRVNYAMALLQDEQFEVAAAELEVAEEMTDDQAVIADIERLFLEADNPDFEALLGEVTELVTAGRPLGARHVEFLEEAIDQAQSFSQGYLLLARGYLNSDATSAALEVLLDGQKYLPEDAEITAQLARVLWESDEHDLAFDYLNKGLKHNPDDVVLLALSGRYLFDEGQDEEARTFLLRAQSLEPRNRTLVEAQRHISRQMGL